MIRRLKTRLLSVVKCATKSQSEIVGFITVMLIELGLSSVSRAPDQSKHANDRGENVFTP